ncbi:hypothetical protein NE237_000720 [Protea cynaroides]|uniref:Uncharacterized protein n=1 Tax=Protea cynaroides TaxID=273540 RepID=A0A9Q0QXR7_9MAGN|nr:hypothetical protein NE237_000720 [Protea cynaroides]
MGQEGPVEMEMEDPPTVGGGLLGHAKVSRSALRSGLVGHGEVSSSALRLGLLGNGKVPRRASRASLLSHAMVLRSAQQLGLFMPRCRGLLHGQAYSVMPRTTQGTPVHNGLKIVLSNGEDVKKSDELGKRFDIVVVDPSSNAATLAGPPPFIKALSPLDLPNLSIIQWRLENQ